ncbi:MAG: two-component system, OmpR family, KDP operon response regulator KdpE [Chloroflexi bacterium]|nr:MAG: two-component system, OmpR family, KDP operon response regulator KdpE [Chloroflexota bacterium]
MVVDDDPGILELLTLWLEKASYRVVAANSGEQALRLFFDNHPALSIVDLRMRGMDGFHVISRMREMSDAPIMILSALDDEDTVVRGLTLGADEFLVKPVSPKSFIARVQAILRLWRTNQQVETPFDYADAALTLDLRRHEVTANGHIVGLRPLEFGLLAYLVRHRDRMVGYAELLDRVWAPDAGSPDSLKWYVSSLRKKIEIDTQHPQLILNIRSLGYRYVPADQAPE